MKRTQIERVKDRLKARGFITRNECLQNYITRLATIVQKLENEGWVFDAGYRDGDYVYKVVSWGFDIENKLKTEARIAEAIEKANKTHEAQKKGPRQDQITIKEGVGQSVLGFHTPEG